MDHQYEIEQIFDATCYAALSEMWGILRETNALKVVLDRNGVSRKTVKFFLKMASIAFNEDVEVYVHCGRLFRLGRIRDSVRGITTRPRHMPNKEFKQQKHFLDMKVVEDKLNTYLKMALTVNGYYEEANHCTIHTIYDAYYKESK